MAAPLIPRSSVVPEVLGWIARRVLHSGDANRAEEERILGSVRLLEHQVDAVRRLRPAIERHGGALLADDVGLGKTYVALAIAAPYQEIDIIAPAVLVPMWREALGRTGQTHACVRSLHRFSRGAIEPPIDAGRRLVIIDEAHHLRTAGTLRYGRVAQFVIGADVLLLSATPVHNRPADLASLLALFSGVRGDQLHDARLAELVVRRRAGDPSFDDEESGIASPPAVASHRHVIPNGDPRILKALRELPPPLPVADGSAATGLVRLALLRAWCSSDAALAAALHRRRMRGAAMLQSLGSGRLPSREELRSWATGEDGVQLGFVELLVHSRHGADANATFTRTLDAHLQALAYITESLAASSLDDVRVATVRSLVAGTGAPIVLFSQFASTARAYFRKLAPMGGIGLLTGSGAELASGRIARTDVLSRFGPPVPGAESFASHARVRALVATDLLAEGVNLQHARSVVHLDLPWTDALLRQRVGRIARIGAPHAVVHAHTLEPPPDAAAAVRVLELLARKSSDAERVVGGTGNGVAPSAGSARASAADAATRLRALLRAWSLRDGDGGAGACMDGADVDQPPVLAAGATAWTRTARRGDAGIALVRTGARVVLLALMVPDGTGDTAAGWQATDDLDTVLRIAERLDGVRDVVSLASLSGGEARRACEAVRGWDAGRRSRSAMGREPAAVSAAQRRALREIGAAVAEATLLERARTGNLAVAARDMVEAACAVGTEEALQEWTGLRTSRTVSLPGWLGAWRRSPLLRRASEGAVWRRRGSPAGAGDSLGLEESVVIEALVLLDGRLLRTGGSRDG